MRKKIYAFFCLTSVSTFLTASTFSQCATSANISSAGDCISLSWTGIAVPSPLPASIEFLGELFTFNNGLGDVPFPAIYTKIGAVCTLPSSLLSGNLTVTDVSGSFICEYPSGTLLALHDIRLRATAGKQFNEVHWSAKNDASVDKYELERSRDGLAFSTIFSIKANGKANQSYSFRDQNIAVGGFYRLKVTEKNSSVWYSKIVRAEQGPVSPATVFPNPGKGFFTVTGITATSVKTLAIYDVHGRKVPFSTNTINSDNQSVNIQLKGNNKGVLFVQYLEGKEKVHARVVVQ